MGLLLNGECLSARAAYRKMGLLKLTPHVLNLRERGWNIRQELGHPDGVGYRLAGREGCWDDE